MGWEIKLSLFVKIGTTTITRNIKITLTQKLKIVTLLKQTLEVYVLPAKTLCRKFHKQLQGTGAFHRGQLQT